MDGALTDGVSTVDSATGAPEAATDVTRIDAGRDSPSSDGPLEAGKDASDGSTWDGAAGLDSEAGLNTEAGPDGEAGLDGAPETGGSGGAGGSDAGDGSSDTGGTGGIGGAGGAPIVCATPSPAGVFCDIAPGQFLMGSPTGELGQDTNELIHSVTLTRSYVIQSTEVTQDDWLSVMGKNPSTYSSCGGDCPVETVTWYMAVVYSNRLSAMAGLETCYADADDGTTYDEADASAERTPTWPKGPDCLGYRLPTEAEWEYAARAGSKTAFFTGGIATQECTPLDPNLDIAGWYCGNTEQNVTHPVKRKLPNPWGLYDTHGNVWEWTWDAKSEYTGDALVDPLGGPAEAYMRMVRGGSFYDNPGMCRSAVRSPFVPAVDLEAAGLRIARTLPKPEGDGG